MPRRCPPGPGYLNNPAASLASRRDGRAPLRDASRVLLPPAKLVFKPILGNGAAELPLASGQSPSCLRVSLRKANPPSVRAPRGCVGCGAMQAVGLWHWGVRQGHPAEAGGRPLASERAPESILPHARFVAHAAGLRAEGVISPA